MSVELPTRDELASAYLDQLPFEPYPVQEEALLAWFDTDEGVLVCAPTGTGKTLIAEAAIFEALHRREVCYYTTPLIALTEQKFDEIQKAAADWGFHPDDVGLVTGNRKVNPEAKVLVVVAEILLNRLLHTEAFDFSEVASVVMDEFHSFNDPERGMVWELTLAMLPKHVRLLLLSATVGNSYEFLRWLELSHGRDLKRVESSDRKVPLSYHYVNDLLLPEQLTEMSEGGPEGRKTPALVFCFNREECWNVAEQLKGKSLLAAGQQDKLATELKQHDMSKGAGPKLKQLLLRGVGVHHAGLLPRYRRLVERLFQQKLLSVCMCTETLSAGINLPARSVVLTSLLKGPKGKKKLVEASSAHQIFGRAGRPQFDTEGHVYAMAHEDDVKIQRWKEKYDQIPEDTKDPGLRKAKKQLKKKQPTRRSTEQYWNEAQFEKLKSAPAGNLASRGPLPWRLLAYLLDLSPDVARIREVVRKRLMDPKRLERAEQHLDEMLLTLYAAGYVRLEPEPPKPEDSSETEQDSQPKEQKLGLLGKPLDPRAKPEPEDDDQPKRYRAEQAHPTELLPKLLGFRSVNPLYGVFLVEQLGIADHDERVQAMESVLEVPRSMAKSLRVPPPWVLAPGPLQTTRLDMELMARGLISAEELQGDFPDPDEDPEARRYIPPLGEKLRMLFDSLYPGVTPLNTLAVWAAGELLHFGGDFNKYITSHNLVKQEGIIFRHVLRMILLCDEFATITPSDCEPAEWQESLKRIADDLTAACQQIDPESTDKFIEQAHSGDIVESQG